MGREPGFDLRSLGCVSRFGLLVYIVGGLEGAKTVLDATGLTVTPGFIDSHSHSDSAILEYPGLIEKIEQGITTSIAGQCGSSPAPISRNARPEKAVQLGNYGKSTDIYRTFATFLDTVKDVPTGSNTATLVGHGALREAAMGMDNRPPTQEEYDANYKTRMSDSLLARISKEIYDTYVQG